MAVTFGRRADFKKLGALSVIFTRRRLVAKAMTSGKCGEMLLRFAIGFALRGPR